MNRCNTGIHSVFSCEPPNGASASYSYDSTGKLTSLSHKGALGLPIDSFSYTHDKAHRVSRLHILQNYTRGMAQETDPLNMVTSYSYDSKGNLTSKTDAKYHRDTG